MITGFRRFRASPVIGYIDVMTDTEHKPPIADFLTGALGLAEADLPRVLEPQEPEGGWPEIPNAPEHYDPPPPHRQRKPYKVNYKREDMDLVMSLFLEAYAACRNISHACRTVGVSAAAVNYRRKNDPAFKAAFEMAQDMAFQRMEDEAYRRAVFGVEKVKYHQGIPIGVEREYSDTLMQMLLKAGDPDKYKDRQKVEHEGEIKSVHTLVVPATKTVEAWQAENSPTTLEHKPEE